MPQQKTHRDENQQQKRAREYTNRRFSAGLHRLYLALTTMIEGIEDRDLCSHYASLLLHRLMFMYFLQSAGRLANDRHYLQRRLNEQRANGGGFYRSVLRPLFTAAGRSEATTLPGASLFCSHEIERHHPALDVPDELFAYLFTLFDAYQWQIHEHASDAKDAITPEILGVLFEQQMHLKEAGAYYTPHEITAYIVRNTLLPALFTRVRVHDAASSAPESLLWQTLVRAPLRYLYATARKGYASPLPPEIAAGVQDVSQRAAWRQCAPTAFALPDETWREVIDRREHVDAILARAGQPTPVSLDRLVSWNLDQPLLALETLRTCEQPGFLQACYESLRQLSVLDPTCGSGAFLCAALPLLQDLSVACLDRMEELCRGQRAATLPPAYQCTWQRYLEEAGPPALRASSSLRWIIAHNLYGVDLNEEAVEVCRLRFYLKLLAALPARQPALIADDFAQHICAGNSLLGSLTADPDPQAAQTAPGQERYRRTLHWQQTFPAPMARGGFDVVIGNPPYVEYKRVCQFYTLNGYTTLETGNLYALTMERAVHLLAPGGRFGMIVPSSATCTHGYRSLQKLLLAQQELHVASFSDQRGHLFALPHPRLCIIFYARTSPPSAQTGRVFATPYLKLTKEPRSDLFERLSYTEVTSHTRSGLIPRYGSALELAIDSKLARQPHTLGAYLQRAGPYPIYFTRKLSWYVQVTPFIPHICDGQGQTRVPSELKYLRFSSLPYARIVFAALNSNLFYWLITTGSDCRNLNMREVRNLPLDLATIDPTLQDELCRLSDELERDLLKHARMRPMVFQNKGSLTIQCIYPAYSKRLIDEIDRVLARHYTFDAEELDFLLHYDEKYRCVEHCYYPEQGS